MRQVLVGHHRRDRLDAFLLDQAGRIAQMRQLLGDPARCVFIPVLLPEPPSMAETARLLARLERLRIAAPEIIINRWSSDDAADGLRDLLGESPSAGFGPSRRLWCLPRLEEQPGARIPLVDWLARARRLDPSAPASCRTGVDGRNPSVLEPAPLPDAPLLHLFAGKGGVGKTTLACATALRLAAAPAARPVLLLSCDPAHSLGDLLGQPLGPEPTAVRPGLMASELDAATSLDGLRRSVEEDVQDHFSRLSPGLDLPFDRDATRRLLDLRPPGLDELIALLGVLDAIDGGHFGTLILDTAPSGHLLRLLALPELVEDWLRSLFGLFLKYPDLLDLPRLKARLVRLSKQVKALRALLSDPRRTALCAVTQPQPMVLAETARLLDGCTRLGIACGTVLHNQLLPDHAPHHRAVAAFAAAHPAQRHARIAHQAQPPLGAAALSQLGAALWHHRQPSEDRRDGQQRRR